MIRRFECVGPTLYSSGKVYLTVINDPFDMSFNSINKSFAEYCIYANKENEKQHGNGRKTVIYINGMEDSDIFERCQKYPVEEGQHI